MELSCFTLSYMASRECLLSGARQAPTLLPVRFPNHPQTPSARKAGETTSIPKGSESATRPTLTQLIEHLEELAETQRSMLARKLHDEAGASLVSAMMDLAWVERHSASSGDENQRILKRAFHSLTDTLDMERTMIEQLRPSLLDDVGLFAALRWHMRTTCIPAGLRCAIDLPDPEPVFLKHASIVLFRIVEEALESLMVDQAATKADLKVTAVDRILTVSIQSDGVSASKRKADITAPYSLLRLQHRAASLGGDVQIFGPSSRGTSIAARFSFENSLQ